MRFSKDTSRLVIGRHYWWTWSESETPSTMPYEGEDPTCPHHLWGDECPAPTVEVEPAPPAWVPPVCPAGQFYLSLTGHVCVAGADINRTASGYPLPAWPPRIGEIVEVLVGDQWIMAQVSSGPWADVHGATEYVEVARWSVARSNEGKTWRWVYRDLSGYVPPGGAS